MSDAANQITLTIDGVEVSVAAGTTLLQAAEHAGVVVPHYCYHPGIPSRPAQCRMCLVEIEGQPKLQPSCVFPAGEGMVVHTTSEAAEKARQSVIEFLLLNHPLDCPICDAAGQCMLQDYAFETGQLRSRYAEAKMVLGRDRVADDILYFGDRCIVCTRCVRFMEDIAGDNALVVAQRGHKAYIDTFPGRDLDHAFRGNIVDVCPVGALVHEDFVFKARAWDMDAAPGICPGCSTGCNIEINVKENQVVRTKPRLNTEVNSYWMCDHGRRVLVMANRGVRAEAPMIRRAGELEPASWNEALAWVAEELGGSGGVAVASASVSNEALFYTRTLLNHLGIEGGTFEVEEGAEVTLAGFPKLKLRAERAPNATGAALHGYRRSEGLPEVVDGASLVVLGDALAEAPADYGANAGFFLYIGSHLPPAAGNATAILPAAAVPEMEGTFVNYEGRVQRFHRALRSPGVARPAWMFLSRLLEHLGEGTGVREIGDAFGVMAAGTEAMQGLTWGGLGLRGELLSEAGHPAVAAE
ncbi:MAG: molybdopterin-dependent oxidoreductase [Gemmatimonadetes bacterium]|nr:molybdopterin-dependent oxidoreductase [Gemmatimonadota bacterium]